METAFYHDDVLNATGGISRELSYNMMKKDMDLNLSDPSSSLKSPLREADVLSSTDLGLLKLGSPELERLIIQSNGMVSTTPTSQFHHQRSLSEEQEFAEGFVRALEDLHKQSQLIAGVNGPTGTLDLSDNSAPVTIRQDLPVYASLNNYDNGTLGTTVNYSTDTVPFPPPPSHQPTAHIQVPSLRDEPQIVPDVQSFGDSPPLSPINMDAQERIKAERKKLRNRIAASKCRKRKLERISRLEDKVKILKTQNTDLASTASHLREQVAQLKQKVMNHVNSGCQLLPNQVQAY